MNPVHIDSNSDLENRLGSSDEPECLLEGTVQPRYFCRHGSHTADNAERGTGTEFFPVALPYKCAQFFVGYNLHDLTITLVQTLCRSD